MAVLDVVAALVVVVLLVAAAIAAVVWLVPCVMRCWQQRVERRTQARIETYQARYADVSRQAHELRKQKRTSQQGDQASSRRELLRATSSLEAPRNSMTMPSPVNGTTLLGGSGAANSWGAAAAAREEAEGRPEQQPREAAGSSKSMSS